MKEIILDKIKSKLALVFIIIIMITGSYWLFGFLFLIWVVLDLKNRQTYLMEIIPRNTNPILYWSVVLMWFTFTIFSFLNY